jgi:hypothetical protein
VTRPTSLDGALRAEVESLLQYDSESFLEGLPADPRERNFWSFYENNWLRQETREYVASIFAAALICEDGEVFNFPVEKIW